MASRLGDPILSQLGFDWSFDHWPAIIGELLPLSGAASMAMQEHRQDHVDRPPFSTPRTLRKGINGDELERVSNLMGPGTHAYPVPYLSSLSLFAVHPTCSSPNLPICAI